MTSLLVFEDGGHGGLVLLPVSYLLMPLYLEGQNLPGNQISSTYLSSSLRYNYFRFGKQTSAVLEFYLQFQFWLYHRNRHAILHQAAKLHPNRTTYCGNMTLYRSLPHDVYA